MKKSEKRTGTLALAAVLGAVLIASDAEAADKTLDEFVVKGRQCLGFGCPNQNFMEIYNQETLKLKDDTLRIRFDDTSVFGFPANDWMIVINDSHWRGTSRFSIHDVTHNTTPFTVEDGAPSHSLYVEADDFLGRPRVGIGTSAPARELHIVSRKTPGVRLQQDGSSGSPAQSWEVIGNENGFFVRDDTKSRSPLALHAGAHSGSLAVEANGDVRIGTGLKVERGAITNRTLTIDEFGNFSLGGVGAGSAGAQNTLMFFWDANDPTFSFPTSSPANGVLLYPQPVAGSTELRVRDEAGNVTTLSPHNFDGFEPDPDDPFPWSYHSRNAFLGQEIWVDMSGAIRALEKLTGETFIHRRTFEKADWATAKQAAADAVREGEVLRKTREEEVEVPHRDAIEAVEVMETVPGHETETVYRFDPETGAVEASERPVMVERPTGERRMRIKPGIRFDERTGKFYRNKTRAEAEAEVPAATAQKMPGWIAARVDAR